MNVCSHSQLDMTQKSALQSFHSVIYVYGELSRELTFENIHAGESIMDMLADDEMQVIGVLQCVAVCCNVLQCVSVYCSVLQCVAVCGHASR